MSERLARTCSGCNVTDAHAHHVQYVAVVHPVTGTPMDITVSKHIQCCAADGCAICATDLEFAPDESIGDAFTANMQAKPAEHLTALALRHGVSIPGEV